MAVRSALLCSTAMLILTTAGAMAEGTPLNRDGTIVIVADAPKAPGQSSPAGTTRPPPKDGSWANGLPTGQRMHKPFVITKELDKTTPLLFNVVGESDRHTILKSETGELFYFDTIGNRKVLPSLPLPKTIGAKVDGKVSAVGIDEQGNTFLKNGQGKLFYLDPMTGNLIPVNLNDVEFPK